MAYIKELRIQHLRNLTEVQLFPSPELNLIIGVNGSGKSSLLEAIYLLSHGRSFRSSSKLSLIQYNIDSLNLFTEISTGENLHRIGVQKSQHGNTKLRINGEYSRSLAAAAELLPVVLVNPNSDQLMDEGPSHRREYLDWILFHVEHDYPQCYQEFEQALKQRNAALRQQYSRSDCIVWDEVLIDRGLKITELRRSVLKEIEPYFQTLLARLNINIPIRLDYMTGWGENPQQTFSDALQQSFLKDMALGYTTVGPQRADINILSHELEAASIVSRGQEKLIITSLTLAKALYYEAHQHQMPIILLDDIASELDPRNRQALFDLLDTVPAQYFITATEDSIFPPSLKERATMFHVEHGVIMSDMSFMEEA